MPRAVGTLAIGLGVFGLSFAIRCLYAVDLAPAMYTRDQPGTRMAMRYDASALRMLAGDGLKPSKFGKRVHFNGTKRSVTDGPFAETKELVAGFWIWQVRSMDEAIEWAKRCPNPMPGPSDLEIRPLWESADFGPEIAAQENELRAEIAKQKK